MENFAPKKWALVAVAVLLITIKSAQCAKLIPLIPYDDTSTNSDYHHNNKQFASSSVPEVVNSQLSQQQQSHERQVVSSSASVTTIDPTEMQLWSEAREARRMRQDTTSTQKPRKKKQGLMEKILPMLVMPFLISSSLIPMMLTSLKFMLLKSLFVGKIAIVLLALNALWKSDNRGGVYSHNVNYDPQHEQKDLHMNHYGYNGDEEYGAYVNRRSGRQTEFRR